MVYVESQRKLSIPYIRHILFFTFSFGAIIVLFAEQLLVLHQVELVPRVELAAAEDAHEAVHVVHVVLRAPHHRARRDPLAAARALGAVLPEEVFSAEHLVVLHEALVPERLGAGGAAEALGVPGLVHHLQDEPVQDHAAARPALRDRRCNNKMWSIST